MEYTMKEEMRLCIIRKQDRKWDFNEKAQRARAGEINLEGETRTAEKKMILNRRVRVKLRQTCSFGDLWQGGPFVLFFFLMLPNHFGVVVLFLSSPCPAKLYD